MKYQDFPTLAGSQVPNSASNFKLQLSGSLLCLLGSPPALPLQINTHTPYPSHSLNGKLHSSGMVSAKAGAGDGLYQPHPEISSRAGQSWGDFKRSNTDWTFLGWEVRIPWVLNKALKYRSFFLFKLCFSFCEGKTSLFTEDCTEYE